MTESTIINYTGMIKCRRNECSCVMTNATILASRNVVECFWSCQTRSVTGRAVIYYARMRKSRRQKARGLMTGDAVLASGYMTTLLA